VYGLLLWILTLAWTVVSMDYPTNKDTAIGSPVSCLCFHDIHPMFGYPFSSKYLLNTWVAFALAVQHASENLHLP